jgi:hypothetical protein
VLDKFFFVKAGMINIEKLDIAPKVPIKANN